MKVMISILSLLIILAGLLPFLGVDGLKVLPESIPTKGVSYSIIVIIMGLVGFIYGFSYKLLVGTEKFVTLSIALLTVLGGILPLISEFITLPIKSPLYPGALIIIGVIGLFYGIVNVG